MNKTELLDLLFKHQGLLNQKDSKNGITFWAIITGLGSLIWLLLNTIDTYSQTDIDSSILLLINFILIKEVIARENLFNKKSAIKQVHYLDYRVNYAVYQVVYLGIIFVFALFKVHNLNQSFQGQQLLIDYYMARNILNAVIILIILIKKPVLHPNSYLEKLNRHWYVPFLSFIMILIGCTVIVSIGVRITAFNINIIKLTLLSVALHILILKLIDTFRYTSLLKYIDALIMQVSFDRIDLNRAKDEFRIIMLGKNFNDVSSPLIKNHLKLNEDIIKIQRTFDLSCKELQTAEGDRIMPIYDSLIRNYKSLQSKYDLMVENIEKVINILEVHSDVKEDKEEISKVIKTLKGDLDYYKQSNKNSQDELERTRESINQKLK